ncbi:unnamed protein product [Mytilus coruscus]|uniref:Uncharacterized protein n=1 Tax=Mytilus coruscus TaxID=42192 RepID=A0A6J8ADD2_MYTCO|nr:unnamed protein product [Mytilus coruscus]
MLSVWLFIFSGAFALSSKPEHCSVYSKNAAIYCDCESQGLSHIKQSCTQNTSVAFYSHYNFQTLGNNAFRYTKKLREHYLTYCYIRLIDTLMFNGLKRLTKLDLSYNVIMNLPSGVFKPINGILSLNIVAKRMQRYPDEALQDLILLEDLTMTPIVNDTFRDGFSSLKNLKTFSLREGLIPGATMTYLTTKHSIILEISH